MAVVVARSPPDDASLESGGYKRINCILLQYYVTSINSKSSVIECSVGMYYVRNATTTNILVFSVIHEQFNYYTIVIIQYQDGTPMELEPFMTWDGIAFSYLDTSSNEELVSWQNHLLSKSL